MEKITNQQRLEWFLARKCHICGSDKSHNHPNWMWLAHPIPELPEDASTERKELAESEKQISKTILSKIIGN